MRRIRRRRFAPRGASSPAEAAQQLVEQPPEAYPKDRLEREKLIFRTYDQDNVNIIRPDHQR